MELYAGCYIELLWGLAEGSVMCMSGFEARLKK